MMPAVHIELKFTVWIFHQMLLLSSVIPLITDFHTTLTLFGLLVYWVCDESIDNVVIGLNQQRGAK